MSSHSTQVPHSCRKWHRTHIHALVHSLADNAKGVVSITTRRHVIMFRPISYKHSQITLYDRKHYTTTFVLLTFIILHSTIKIPFKIVGTLLSAILKYKTCQQCRNEYCIQWLYALRWNKILTVDSSICPYSPALATRQRLCLLYDAAVGWRPPTGVPGSSPDGKIPRFFDFLLGLSMHLMKNFRHWLASIHTYHI